MVLGLGLAKFSGVTVAAGADWVGVVLRGAGRLEPEEEGPLRVLVDVAPLEAVPAEVLVVSQLAVTLLTGGVPGGSMSAGGVPGAAVTLKVSVWPFSRVAVTVHESAEASGTRTVAMTPRTRPSRATHTLSDRGIDTAALSRFTRTER